MINLFNTGFTVDKRDATYKTIKEAKSKHFVEK
jgi:hypothetical protein